MDYKQALKAAQVQADATGSSVLVYRSTLTSMPVYGIAYTLPAFGERVGERINPNKPVSFSDAYKPLELND